jgi:hypothetical protein
LFHLVAADRANQRPGTSANQRAFSLMTGLMANDRAKARAQRTTQQGSIRARRGFAPCQHAHEGGG